MGRGRKAVPKVDLPTDRVEALTRWAKVSAELATLKVEEHALRMKLVQESFDIAKLEGVETIDIGWGYRLKATKVLNYTATNEASQTENLLNVVGQIDPGIAQALVKWKPDVSIEAYRKLLLIADADPPLRELMAAAITVKPGMPQLEMIPPKAEAAAPVEIESGVTMTDGSDIKF